MPPARIELAHVRRRRLRCRPGGVAASPPRRLTRPPGDAPARIELAHVRRRRLRCRPGGVAASPPRRLTRLHGDAPARIELAHAVLGNTLYSGCSSAVRIRRPRTLRDRCRDNEGRRPPSSPRRVSRTVYAVQRGGTQKKVAGPSSRRTRGATRRERPEPVSGYNIVAAVVARE